MITLSPFLLPYQEELVIVFKLLTGDKQVVRIPVGTLIREWEVDNSIPDKVVEMEKVLSLGTGADKLSADIRLHIAKDNILVKEGNALYVKGTSDNITHDSKALDVVISELQSDIDSHLKDFNNPHRVTPAQIGAISLPEVEILLKSKADLVSGKVPSSQLPSYVDDVLEFANLSSFPATGESGKIYIAIDTNLTYRWGGSSYVVMSSSLALGETSSTAYRGDYGKVAYEHSQKTTGNPHGTKLDELTDVSGDATSIVDTDVILKKETGGFWKKITFANFKNWFTNELAKKINIGVDTFFNFKNISAMALSDFRSITPNIETIYFTEEQNSTGWQQVRHSPLLYSTFPALIETAITINDENHLECRCWKRFNF
jgi:hypothetical protein